MSTEKLLAAIEAMGLIIAIGAFVCAVIEYAGRKIVDGLTGPDEFNILVSEYLLLVEELRSLGEKPSTRR